MAFGLSPEGGSPHARHSTRGSESDLWRWVRLERAAGAPRWGFFLRAETMHGLYTYLEDIGGPSLHEMSHGESFLEVLRTRFGSPGLYCLDEPEAALSFSAQLALVGTLHELAEGGAQILCATHSPLLAALPGATLLELGPWGIGRRRTATSSWSHTGRLTSPSRLATCGTCSEQFVRSIPITTNGPNALTRRCAEIGPFSVVVPRSAEPHLRESRAPDPTR